MIRPPGRTVGLAPLTALELSPPRLVESAAQAGFDAVGLRLIPATAEEPAWPSIGDTPLIERTRKLLDATGIELLDIEVLRLTPTTRVADFIPFLETGAYLGAREILVAGNDPDPHRAADRLAELAELAAGYGLTPNLEPMPYNDVKTVAQATAIVDRAGPAGVGILVDALHFYRGGNRIAELAALPAHRFRYLQVCDGPARPPTSLEQSVAESRTARLLPGHGELDLTGLLLALPDGLPVSVEAPTAGAGAPVSHRLRAACLAAHRLLDGVDRYRSRQPA
ncbi:sugar phosphate isomerase/epimerase family protein [Mycolicibacterium thermoresistibile]